MVRVGSFLLASALGAQTLWAASIPNTPHGERDVRPRIKRGTKFSPAYYCPDMLGLGMWECDDEYCGGENSNWKGHCTLPVKGGATVGKQQSMSRVTYCKCGPKGSSGGGKPPPVIVIPPPVGFVPPPAGVPSVKDPKQCPEDYSTTDCSDCKPLEGWCTVGPQAGCPCREECPTDDDKKPKCGDVACQGEETGTCTVGHYLDCECQKSCPDLSKEVLDCASDGCVKDEDEDKCTSDAFKNCACDVVYHEKDYLPGTTAEMEQINSVLASVPKLVEDSNKAAKPNVTCSSDDYTKAVNVDIVFMQSLANKFCNGTSDSATLTNKDLGSTAYDGYSFQFDYTAWDDCTANCTEAYKAAISACKGLDPYSVQPLAIANYTCGSKYSYDISSPKSTTTSTTSTTSTTPTSTSTSTAPTSTTTSSSGKLGSQQCHSRDEFGSHGDVRAGDISRAAMGCAEGDGVSMTSDSDPIKVTGKYGGTWLEFITSWIDGCEGPAQDSRYPLGGKHILGNSCWELFLNDWQNCINGGAGGYIDAGCLRYDFRPTDE